MRPRFLALLVLASLLRAETPAVKPTTVPAAPDPQENEPMKIQGIFNTELPRVAKKNRLKVTFHPAFGDLSNRDYLRMPLGFRYGLTDRIELNAEVESYIAHGLGGETFGSDIGLSSVGMGVRYRWADWLRPYFDSASGIRFRTPIGSPPTDITDGLRHINPGSTFSHRWRTRPELTSFVSFSGDFVERTSTRGEIRKDQFGEDSWTVTPGMVWNREPFNYTLELSYTTTALLSDTNKNLVSIRPAVTWNLPKKLTFNSKGRWVIGLGVRVSNGPRGTDVGLSAKLRGEFDLKKFLGWRATAKK
jgi:hypothetical protein